MVKNTKLEEINGVVGKVCTRCNKWNQLSEFHKSPQGVGGAQSACKPCDSERSKERYNNNREKRLAKNKEWRIKNKEYLTEYRQKNKEVRNIQTKEWHEKNPNYLKKWFKDKPEYMKDYMRGNTNYVQYHSEYYKKYRIDNKERLLKYKKDNNDKFLLYSNRRRARKTLLPDCLTIEEQNDIFNYFDGCALTGDKSSIHWDHVIPLSMGHGGTTSKNMIPIRADLNMSKHNSNIFKWFKHHKERLNLCQKRFNYLIQYLAEKNNMTVEGYKKHVNKCHKNPKPLESQQITLSL